MQDRVYSSTLLLSLLLGSTALAAGLLDRTSRGGRGRFVLPACVCGAWLAVFASLTVHLAWGHTPGSAGALPAVEFLRRHPAFLIASLLPAAAILLRRGRRASGADAADRARSAERDRP